MVINLPMVKHYFSVRRKSNYAKTKKIIIDTDRFSDKYLSFTTLLGPDRYWNIEIYVNALSTQIGKQIVSGVYSIINNMCLVTVTVYNFFFLFYYTENESKCQNLTAYKCSDTQ